MNKFTSLLLGTALAATVATQPAQAFFWYSPNAEKITESIGVTGQERNRIERIIEENYDSYMDDKGEFAEFRDTEITLMAYVADALNVHTFPKGYFLEHDNLIPDVTRRLIDYANEHDVTLQTLAEVVSDHEILAPAPNGKHKWTVGDLASSVELVLDRPRDKLDLARGFLHACGTQDTYSALSEPASSLVDNFPKVDPDSTLTRLAYLSKISEDKKFHDPETLLEALRHSEGLINTDGWGANDDYNSVLDILVQSVPQAESPVTYTRLAGELYGRLKSLQESKDISWTFEEMKSDLEDAGNFLREKGHNLTPETVVGLALKMPVEGYQASMVQEHVFKKKLTKTPDTLAFYNSIMSVPFITENIEALQFKGRYRPLNEANFWKDKLHETADMNDLQVDSDLESQCRKAFKTLSRLPVVGGFTDFDPSESKLKQLPVLERIQGYTYELINNAVDFTVTAELAGYSFKDSLEFLEDFAEFATDKDKLAYYVKNANLMLVAGSRNGHSLDQIADAMALIAQTAPSEKGYLHPEKYAGAVASVLDSLEPGQVDSYEQVFNRLVLHSMSQENFLESQKYDLVPNVFVKPAVKIVQFMDNVGLTLDETLERMDSVMESWQETKVDMERRPHVYKGKPELGILQPEKLANDIMKTPQENFYETEDAILAAVKAFKPEANQLFKDNPNILEKSIQQYRARTPHLTDEARIDILQGVEALNLSEYAFDSVDLSKIGTSEHAYYEGLDIAGIYAEKLFRAAAEFGNIEAIEDGAVSYTAALDFLEFFNKKCNDERNESRLLYVRKTGDVINGAYSHGIGLDAVQEITSQLIQIPDLEVQIPGIEPNSSRYTPRQQYNYRSIAKVANAWTDLFDAADSLTDETLLHVGYIAKHLSFLVEPQEDVNALVANAYKFYEGIREFCDGNGPVPGSIVADQVQMLYSAADPEHNYHKVGKLPRDALRQTYLKLSNEAGILPR
ncbi:MAG: hypothetical protein ACQESG_00850 [Nanobdellota archaeon]